MIDHVKESPRRKNSVGPTQEYEAEEDRCSSYDRESSGIVNNTREDGVNHRHQPLHQSTRDKENARDEDKIPYSAAPSSYDTEYAQHRPTSPGSEEDGCRIKGPNARDAAHGKEHQSD